MSRDVWTGRVEQDAKVTAGTGVTESNGMHLVLFYEQSRTFGPSLAAIIGILISGVWRVRRLGTHSRSAEDCSTGLNKVQLVLFE
jgi:flagellar biogenesis protein FliO